MIQPVSDEALQQVRSPEKWAVGWRVPAKRDVISTACSGVPPIKHELLRSQADRAGLLIESNGVCYEFTPVGRRMDIHFNNAGIGSDLEDAQA